MSCFAVQNGALELEGGELSFETGPDGKPRKVEGKTHLPMMSVVAEMMIFANAAVAHRTLGPFLVLPCLGVMPLHAVMALTRSLLLHAQVVWPFSCLTCTLVTCFFPLLSVVVFAVSNYVWRQLPQPWALFD